MRLLKREDYRRMPWKNGMGMTEEVLSFPPGSDIASFDWRLSIAHVDGDGPFSVFAGVDRTIALLDGEGLLLDLPDETIALDRKGDPFAFSGDLKISSRNKAGPTVDLNIMTRRGVMTHVMNRLHGGLLSPIQPGAILVFNTPAEIATPDGVIAPARFDALVIEAGDGQIALPDGVDVLMIGLASAAGRK